MICCRPLDTQLTSILPRQESDGPSPSARGQQKTPCQGMGQDPIHVWGLLGSNGDPLAQTAGEAESRGRAKNRQGRRHLRLIDREGDAS
jgi:hypothetical protein